MVNQMSQAWSCCLLFSIQRNQSVDAFPQLTSARSAFGIVALRPLPLDLTCGVDGDALLVVGGCNGPEPLATVEMLRLPSFTWHSSIDLLESRSAPSAGMTGGKVVVCGGFKGESLASVEIRDETRGAWLQGPPMRAARCSFGMVEVGGALFACGGSGTDGMLTTMEVLDLRCKRWSSRSQMPEARSCFGATQVGEFSFTAAGGHDGQDTLDIVNIYDVRADRWQRMPPLAHARSAASVVLVDSLVWAVGGYDGHNTLTTCETLRHSQEEKVMGMDMAIPRTGLGVVPVCLADATNAHCQDLIMPRIGNGSNKIQQQRIVSLSQTHTLMLYELHAAEHVIAIDSFSSQRPEGFREIPRLDSFAPDVEAIRRLKPSIVITSFSSQLGSTKLECPVLLLEAPKGNKIVDDIFHQLHVMADLVGAEETATKITKNIQQRLVAMQQAAAPLFGCSYFLELDSELYTATSSAFMGHFFSTHLGLCNCADAMEKGPQHEYFPATMGELFAADPHFYVVAHTGVSWVEKDPRASVLRAVKKGCVIRTPVHYDQVAWSPRLLDLIEESLRRMLQRRHSSLPPVSEQNDKTHRPEQLVESLRSLLAMDGLDLVSPFCVGWYNRKLLELESTWARDLRPLPDFGHGDDCLAFLIGNTRAVWTPFTIWMRADHSRFDLDHPFDTFIHEVIERVCKVILCGVFHEVFWSCDESSDRMIAMQRVAEVSGLAQLEHSLHLSVHHTYGTWISLRAVIVCDLPGHTLIQPQPSQPLLSVAEKDGAAVALQLALKEHSDRTALCKELHGNGLESCERAMDVWKRWIELRDVVTVGRHYRFDTAQLDFHYTKNRERLRASILGPCSPTCAQSNNFLLVAGGHDGKNDVACAELFMVDPQGNLSRGGDIVPMSKPRGGSGVAFLGGKTYIVGGNEGSSPSSFVEAFDIGTRRWHSCVPLSTARMCPNCASDCNAIYTLGGLVYIGASPVPLSSTEIYVTGADQWVPGPSLLVARCSAGSATLGRRIFICGGFDNEKPLDSMEAMDPREGMWTLQARSQLARSCFACAAIDENRLLVCGGHVGRTAADATYGPTAVCEIYDARKDAWQMAARLDVAAVSPAATVLGSQIFVFGGFDGLMTLRKCQTLYAQDLLASDVTFASQDMLDVPRAGPVVASF